MYFNYETDKKRQTKRVSVWDKWVGDADWIRNLTAIITYEFNMWVNADSR